MQEVNVSVMLLQSMLAVLRDWGSEDCALEVAMITEELEQILNGGDDAREEETADTPVEVDAEPTPEGEA